MNKSVPPYLSELTKLNSEFCRSARIDQDTIEGSNFIYSETIDQFLNILAGHQEGAQKQVLSLGPGHTVVENLRWL